MAAGVYTRTNLLAMLNRRIGGKNDYLTDAGETLNDAVREVLNESDVHLRGTKRRSVLAPNLFNDIHSYTLPSDYNAFIDLDPQINREEFTEWDLLTEEEFNRKKQRLNNIVAIAEDDLVRRLLISRRVDDDGIVLGRLESLGGDGDTWSGFAFIANGDTDNQAVTDSDVKRDATNYVKGSASLRFSDNGDTTATQAGLENRGIGPEDLSEYISTGNIFVRGRLTTGDTNITQLTVRLGSDSDNYYEASDSTTNEDTPFETGWNLVRIAMSGKSTTGTPTDTAIDYVAVFWTKGANTHTGDTDYAFDHVEIKKGVVYDLIYYSRFLWQTTSTVAYKENSTADTDTISLFNDEVQLIITKAAELAFYELGKDARADKMANKYGRDKKKYKLAHPSEAKILTQLPYEFGTVVGNRNFRGDDSSST